MLFIATSMLGYISYQQLKMEMLPNAELPMLFVQVNSRIEVTPEYMEQNAVIPVESAIAGLENIELIESTANRRGGTVYIFYCPTFDRIFIIYRKRRSLEKVINFMIFIYIIHIFYKSDKSYLLFF